MHKPLPEECMSIIQGNVMYYSCLIYDNRQKLQGLIQIFLAEKQFEGCGGLDITGEVRITIAAQACTLLLGHETGIYPKLQTVLVYPHAYIAHMTQRHSDGTIVESLQVRIGETRSQGYLALAWEVVKQSAGDVHDGHNVVFHEFAHQLDYESGVSMMNIY